MQSRGPTSSSTTTSASLGVSMERDAALSDFAAARQEWEEAFARVPDEALRYLKPGDDYSLGGLQVHINWVLAR